MHFGEGGLGGGGEKGHSTALGAPPLGSNGDASNWERGGWTVWHPGASVGGEEWLSSGARSVHMPRTRCPGVSLPLGPVQKPHWEPGPPANPLSWSP